MTILPRKPIFRQKRFFAYIIAVGFYLCSAILPERFSSLVHTVTVMTIIFWLQEIATDIFSIIGGFRALKKEEDNKHGYNENNISSS